MRVYTKYRASKGMRRTKGQGGRKGLIAFVVLALLAGLGWLAGQRGHIQRWPQFLSVPSNTNTAPSVVPAPQPVSATNILRVPTPTNLVVRTNPPSNKVPGLLDAQIVLDRRGFSSGSIDGVSGSQTRATIRAFQLREGLPLTGELNADTRARLIPDPPALTNWRVESVDLARPLPLAATWLGKSEQPRLDYESMLELFAERSHAHPNLLRRLNPQVDWAALLPGTSLTVPSTERERPAGKAAFLVIRLADRTLEAFDSGNRLLAHFPCSIAQRVEKRPVGELRVSVVAPNPNYTFDPEVFPESAEARELGRKLVLPPGPNNPVGTAWIGLDKPGYGIHGTPRPEDVGRTESHGCFRLANWNAEYLLQLVTVGTPVRVEP